MSSRRDRIDREKNRLYRLKISFEKPFKRELKRYFSQQKKRVRGGNTEIIDIIPVLENHYNRIIKKMTGFSFKKNENIGRVVKNVVENRAGEQRVLLDRTTQKQIVEAERLARKMLAESGDYNPNSSTLNKVMAGIFARLAYGRITTIAMTQTQQVVEEVRAAVVQEAQRELFNVILTDNRERAEELASIAEDQTSTMIAENFERSIEYKISILNRASKTWATMGDKRVRKRPISHVSANGQTVAVGAPFVVGGELLMYPGDVSLGASMANISGCRCSVIYF